MRPDIDHVRQGVYGFSAGRALLPILAAIEPRLKAVVLAGAGLSMTHNPAEAQDDYPLSSRAILRDPNG